MEGLIALQLVKHLGSPAHQKVVVEALDELSEDSDELVADLARRFRDTTLTEVELRELIASLE